MASITETEVIICVYKDFYNSLFEKLFTKSEELNDTQKSFAKICIDSKYGDIDFNHQRFLYIKVSVEVQKRIAAYLLRGHKPEIYFSDLVNDMYEEYWGSPEYDKCEVGNSFEDLIWAFAKKCQALSHIFMYNILCDWPGLMLNCDSTRDFLLRIEEVSSNCLQQFLKNQKVVAAIVTLYDKYKKL